MRSLPLRVSCLGPVRRQACYGGGRPGPVPPMRGLRSCAPLRAGPCVRGGLAAGGAVRGWRPVCRPPQGAWPEGPEGREVALPRSVSLPSLGGHQSGCYRRRSVHGGHGLHTALVRVRVSTPGVARVLPFLFWRGSACLS